MKHVNEGLVVDLYVNKKLSFRGVSRETGIDHHRVRRILIKSNVPLTKRPKRQFSEEHKKRIGESNKGKMPWNKGINTPKMVRYKNMRAHIKYDVELDWFLQFDDINRLRYLNKTLTRRRNCVGFTNDDYKAFVIKFYDDPQFNAIYNSWLNGGKKKYLKPSLDHIVPRCKGGTLDLDNLQYLTWFENRCKNDMTQEEWNELKENIGDYFI